MAIRKIVLYPNPILATPTKEVNEINDDIKKIVEDMIETMYDAPGVGLAANQIGLSLRITVIDVEYTNPDKSKNPIVMINPKIESQEGELYEDEGCLSLPGVSEKVKRFQKVSVTFLNIKGEKEILVGEDLLARAIQHECDHLDGKLYIDRLSLLKKEFLKKKYFKFLEEGGS